MRVDEIKELIPSLMGGITKQYFESLTEQFVLANLPKEVAHTIATYRAIYTTLNIISVSKSHHFDLTQTAVSIFASGERMHLLWFRDQLAHDTREGALEHARSLNATR